MKTIPELVHALGALGVVPGDMLMIHASLRAVGPVAGGAEALVEALERAVGPEGTLMMVLGAKDAHAWVNDGPEASRAQLLADAEPFDAQKTPCEPEVGTLAEVFRRLPSTVVSDHPEGRFGARGARARALTEAVPWDDYFGPGSPLQRLCDLGGKVLRLGADLNTTTVLHYAEYLVDLPQKRSVRRHRRVLRDGVPCIVTVDTLDDSHGIVDWPVDYFEEILVAYLATGRGSRGTIGGAASELLDAGDLVAFGVDWMARHFSPLVSKQAPAGRT